MRFLSSNFDIFQKISKMKKILAGFFDKICKDSNKTSKNSTFLALYNKKIGFLYFF